MGKSAALVEMLVILILFQSLSFSCIGANSNGSCIKYEREALLKFKAGLLSNSNSLESWVGDDCCVWEGVSCHNITGHVIKLDLSFQFLRGKVSPYLGNVSNLQYLHLGGNELTTDNLHFVSSLSSLKYLNMKDVSFVDKYENWLQSANMLPSLVELYLSYCGLYNSGHVSHLNLTSLEVLNLRYNNFYSTFPSWFSNISNIQYLDLRGNYFRGSLPNEIGNLNSLAFLYLSANSLEGRLPKTFGKLCNLRELAMESNNFSGEFFGLFGNSRSCIQNSLEYLDLFNNSFSGILPNDLGQFKSLEVLNLCKNAFWGPIPVSIGQLSNLALLDLSYNTFRGPIPVSVGQLYNLTTLDVRNNSLDGIVSELHFSKLRRLMSLRMSRNSIVFDIGPNWVPPFQLVAIWLSSCKLGPQFPQWLKTQQYIKTLMMSDVSISDSVPDWFGNISSYFRVLDLSHNQIFGALPKLRKLNEGNGYSTILLNSNKFEGPITDFPSDAVVLDISNNLLQGQIPEMIGRRIMPLLEFLLICNNHLNGTIPVSLCRMESLSLLDLSKNQLSGGLPNCWRNLQALKLIDLSNNMLSGHVPISLGSIKQLQSLHLKNNRLQGKIPMSFKNLKDLKFLDLSMNAFAGLFPPGIGESLSSLTVLSVHSNKLEGEIPLQLCCLSSLRILNLANNMMGGTIPTCFGNFTAMVVYEKAIGYWGHGATTYTESENGGIYDDKLLVDIKGTELEYTRTLQFLCSIDLSGNSFVGSIPKELFNLSSVQNLNLSRNKLDGHIPWNIDNLKSLESLDLSKNNLSGSIPLSISNLNFLSHLNLSFNNLYGRIPSGNQLQTLDDRSIYIGNSGLCGPPLEGCPGDGGKLPTGHEQAGNTRKDNIEMPWFYSGLGMGFLTGYVGVCSILYFKKSWRYAFFQLVDRIYNKLWVAIAIKANQLRSMFQRIKFEQNA
ncbi:hypothetical protein P3X46_032864 [Hevea brasiliensis]|uniref:Leucine-rich repeat-containing N-terminal plant-type domain-containing protein n=1 Tax=Hevea brasiliensis TaxID=3981 RepID=A0ABQ9KEM4_HEVBR|nr:receptor-like protein EIX1 [Hevea brasiliensis]KAJ9135712.1 hypothetical protein P3X46_032864 [Hevea brasiliensis]